MNYFNWRDLLKMSDAELSGHLAVIQRWLDQDDNLGRETTGKSAELDLQLENETAVMQEQAMRVLEKCDVTPELFTKWTALRKSERGL